MVAALMSTFTSSVTQRPLFCSTTTITTLLSFLSSLFIKLVVSNVICHQLGANHWLYKCNDCGFDARIGCAIAEPKEHVQVRSPIQMRQPVLHHGTSFSAANGPPFQPLVGNNHGNSVQNGVGIMHAVRPNHMDVTHIARPAQNSLLGTTLMGAIEGVVAGATQQVGQFVQSIISGSSSSDGGLFEDLLEFKHIKEEKVLKQLTLLCFYLPTSMSF